MHLVSAVRWAVFNHFALVATYYNARACITLLSISFSAVTSTVYLPYIHHRPCASLNVITGSAMRLFCPGTFRAPHSTVEGSVEPSRFSWSTAASSLINFQWEHSSFPSTTRVLSIAELLRKLPSDFTWRSSGHLHAYESYDMTRTPSRASPRMRLRAGPILSEKLRNPRTVSKPLRQRSHMRCWPLGQGRPNLIRVCHGKHICLHFASRAQFTRYI